MRGARLVVAILLLCPAGGASAQESVPLGGEFQVNTDAAAATNPRLAADGSGNFVVVWQAAGADGSGAGIFARRFDASATALGAPFRVNTYTTNDQRLPAVAMNSAGQFVVAWESLGQDGDSTGAFAQVFDPVGTPVGPEFRVSIATMSGQGAPRVGMVEDGSFVVKWSGSIQGGAYTATHARRYDALGNPQGAPFELPAAHEMAMNGAGEFVVAWAPCCDNVYAQRFHLDGGPAGPEILVPVPIEPPVADRDPSIGIDATGRFIVSWTRGLNRGPNIVARWFEDSGASSGELLVNSYTTGDQSASAIAVRPGGDFVVVWQSTGQDGSGEGLFGQALDAAGNHVGSAFPVNTYTTGHQTAATVAATPGGGFVVAWVDAALTIGAPGRIVARRFATRPDLIFADGFESGDLSAWSLAQTDGDDLQVTAEAAMAATSFGLRAVVDDTAGLFVLDDSPQQESRYRARFLFDPTGYDPGEAAAHRRTHVFLAFAEAPLRRLVQVILRRQSGVYALGARVRQDDNTLADAGFTTISAAPHVVEIHWQQASAAGANDGLFEMWIDGTPAGTLSGLDNDERPIDFVRLGAMSIKSGANGTLAFDEFESRRFTYIGP